MYKPSYGDPVLTLRIPAWQHAALKKISKETGMSVSAMIREHIESILWLNGYDINPGSEQLPGQISTRDLIDENA